MNEAAQTLGERLGYFFVDPALIAIALTHRSAAGASNERLEFLGDAVINLAVAEALYERRPELSEGDLTRMRSSLVNRDTLAALARELDLGALLTLGTEEQRTGISGRRSILEDALEAVLGAVFLDGGFGAARAVVRRLFAECLQALPDSEALKDPKTLLQERLQARGLALPAYALTAAKGPEHARRFSAECRVAELDLVATGSGSSRREAEQAAADALLGQLQA
ncbi:MAG: ribonuclease III [Gammaproteobacteria bacterium]